MEITQSKKPQTLLALLALIGLGLSIQLTSHYYDLRTGMAGFHSFCNLGSKMNCDAVAASQYSEFVAGIPLSAFGAGWYLALLMVALVARNRFWRREAVRFAFLMTVFGLVFSLAYFSIMAFTIQTYCLFCLFLDGVGLFSFLTVLWMKPEKTTGEPKLEFSKWKKLIATLAGCLIVGVIGLHFLQGETIPSSEIDQHVNEVLASRFFRSTRISRLLVRPTRPLPSWNSAIFNVPSAASARWS